MPSKPGNNSGRTMLTGRPDRAERQFEKAIQANPDCTEALRELRLLGKSKR